jgi:hypothetical protein
MNRMFVAFNMLLLCLMITAPAHGQAGFGSISGRVTDPQGKVIPGVKVEAINDATNARQESATNSSGVYELLNLAPGTYTVAAGMASFKKLVRKGVTVQVEDRISLDLGLEIGGAVEIVEVTASAPLLRESDAQTGEVISNTLIQTLPQLNRDPLQLLIVSGNVQGSGRRADGGGMAGNFGNNPMNGGDTRLNGGRAQGIDYLVDGITAGTGAAHGVSGTTPNIDAVEEFKVITNGMSAEYGRVSGGLVEVVTRSGGNQLHGQLFEYFENDHLNANSWQQGALGGKKAIFRNNDFGGVVGGPVYIPGVYNGHNKTFFFFNYDGTRFGQAGTLQTASVFCGPNSPHQYCSDLGVGDQKDGDLTGTVLNGTVIKAYDPNGPQVYNTTVQAWERTQLLGGDGMHVPSNRISPFAKAMLSLMPEPNHTPVAGTSNQNNYQAPQSTTASSNAWSARLDHNLTQNSHVFGRFTRDSSKFSQTPWRGPLSTAPSSRVDGGFGLTLNYSWNVSPTMLFNARLGGHHNPFVTGSSTAADASFNNNIVPYDAETLSLIGPKGLATLNTAWMNGQTSLIDQASSQSSNLTTYDAGVSLTKILNNHTLKFGYEHRRYYDNYQSGASTDWKLVGTPVNQFARDEGWSNQAFVNDTANILLGLISYAPSSGRSDRAMNTNYHAGYAQDDIKATPRLTLNLGLRWDMETPTTERHNKLYFWDPNAPAPYIINSGYSFNQALINAGIDPTKVQTPAWVQNGFPKGALRVAGTPDFPGRSGQYLHPWQFAPRIGAAYKVTSKMVVRGSFGQMYLSTTGQANSVAGGSGVSVADAAFDGWHHVTSAGPFRYFINTYENPYDNPSYITHYTRSAQVANFQSTLTSNGPGGYDRNSHMPYELTWNLGFQNQLTDSFLVEVNYSANRGVGLLGPDLVGRFPKSLYTGGPNGANAANYQTLVAVPTFGQTQEPATDYLGFLEYGRPYFHAFQVMGSNIGKSNYESLNFRAERRLSHNMALIANYTLGWMKDDVGAPNADPGGISNNGGLGFVRYQSVDTLRDVYGYSVLDERHRLVVSYVLGVPIGRGRKFLGDPTSSGAKVLNQVVGGWSFAGTTLWRSGRPVLLDFSNANVGNSIRVEQTFGSWAPGYGPGNAGSGFGGSNGPLLYGPNQPIPSLTSSAVRRLNPNAFLDAAAFTYGNIPSSFSNIRNPSNVNHDLSLMKDFPLSHEGSRFLELRMEGLNIFNIRGFGQYNSKVGDSKFGLITTAGNHERNIQVSMRLFF